MDNKKAKKYNRIKLILSLSGMVIDLAFWLILISGGFNKTFAQYARSISENPLLRFYIFVFILGIITLLLNFPFSFYGSYVVEHQYSLSNQGIGRWIWEQIKGLLVGLILGGILITVLFILLWKQPNWWWFFSWIFILVFSVLLSRIAPLIIFPLFYKFTPLQNEILKQKIFQIAEKWKLHITGVFQFNLSKTTKKANAAFTGLGRSKRVILSDTLLDNFDDDEVETVFAHEIGHYIHRHLIKGIIINGLLSLLGLFLVFSLYSTIINDNNYLPHQLEALPYLGLLLFLYSIITGPISNLISRAFEYQADKFAIEETGKVGVYKGCLQKLGELNLADSQPHPLVEFLFYSHPSIEHRIEKITGVI